MAITLDGTDGVTTNGLTSNGIDDNATSTSITLDASGNVGIGTDSPDSALDVTSAGADVVRISRNDGTSSNFGIHFDDPVNDYYVGVASALNTFAIGNNVNLNTGNYLTIDSSGNVGIGTDTPSEKLNVSGNILATGNVTAYSDERLKSDIETLDGSKVYEMRGVSYVKDGEASSGVIAQELQKVAPELVNDSGEYLSVAYGNLVGYLIEAVKELKSEINELKRSK